MIKHYFYIQYAELFHGYDLFFNSPFFHETSMLMSNVNVNIQIVIPQMQYLSFFTKLI